MSSSLLLNSHNKITGDVKIYFLNLKDADSFIIKHDDYVMMIDTGEEKDLEIVKNKLEELNIKTINKLILTHKDKDHIGNAEYIIKNYEVLNIIQNDYDKNSDIEKSFNKKVKSLGILNNVISKNYNFYESGISFHLYATNLDYDSNNSSIVVLLKYGDTNVFFGGDIEKDRINELLNYNLPKCHIVKLPHHGRYNEKAVDLLNKLKPTDIISTGEIDIKIKYKYNGNYYQTYDDEIVIKIRTNSYTIKGDNNE